ncbi:MAG: hypothetical protein IT330_11420 [Anaerolineae bacterium]|nr:hypothetical protein [Anaerolineae bacterium]
MPLPSPARKSPTRRLILALIVIAILLAGCSAAAPKPTRTPALPIATHAATATLAPTATPVRPMATRAATTTPAPTDTIEATATAKPSPRPEATAPTSLTLPGNRFQLDRLQQPEAMAGEGQNPFVQLFPDAGRAPAPNWLREGSRVTYYVQSATIAQDPDEGSAGAGWVQYDLVALDGETAVAATKFYLDAGNGVVLPSITAFSLGIPGAGDYWLDPAILKTAERVANDQLVVVHIPTTISGKKYNAVRFEYHPEGAEYVWMFDEVTGVLLFYRHAIGKEGDARRQLADATFVRQRQLKLPWQAEAAPDWVEAGASLRYEGTYDVAAMGSPAGSLPYEVRVEMGRSQGKWSRYKVTDYVSGRTNGVAERITGVAQLFDALWLPPEALAALRTAKTLDRDPVTGAQIAVARGRSGTIVLTESGESYYTKLTYDGKDGTLLAIEQETTSGAATIHVALQLVERG